LRYLHEFKILIEDRAATAVVPSGLVFFFHMVELAPYLGLWRFVFPLWRLPESLNRLPALDITDLRLYFLQGLLEFILGGLVRTGTPVDGDRTMDINFGVVL